MAPQARHRGDLSPELRRLRRGEWSPAFRTVFTTRRHLLGMLWLVIPWVVLAIILSAVGADAGFIAGVIAVGIGVAVGSEMKSAAGRTRRALDLTK